jgi:hypothetical protein
MYVRFNVTSIYGSASYLLAGNAYDKVYDVYGHARIYIKFDLNAVPFGVKINSAVLKLFMYFTPSSPQTFQAHKVLSDWSEKTLNWTNQPSWAAEPTCSSLIETTPNVWASWNITSDVQDWYFRISPNFGTMIKIQVEKEAAEQTAAFHSREFPEHELKPRLEISYSQLTAYELPEKIAVALGFLAAAAIAFLIAYARRRNLLKRLSI